MLSIEYIAGFFDGEGSVNVGRVGKTWNHFVLNVQVTNNKPAVLDEIHSRWGGSLGLYRRKGPNNNSSPTWMWNITAKNATQFLEELTPHLVLKKEQARLGLELLRSIREFRGGRHRPIPFDIANYREDIWKQMKVLNWRGLKPIPKYLLPKRMAA